MSAIAMATLAMSCPTLIQLKTILSLNASWWGLSGNYEEMLDDVCYYI
jgi:hypothetical protein